MLLQYTADNHTRAHKGNRGIHYTSFITHHSLLTIKLNMWSLGTPVYKITHTPLTRSIANNGVIIHPG